MPDDSVHARQSLGERAAAILSDAFSSTENPDPVVLWWDPGGHLEDVVRGACEELGGPDWQKAKGLPLTLRRSAVEGDAAPAVWYVPEGKNDRDWFRDISSPGKEIEKDILELSAELYGVPRWDLLAGSVTGVVDADIAKILKDELTGGRRPTLDRLREERLTRGHGSPLERLLVSDWGETSDPGTREQLRDQLRQEGVPAIEDEDDAETMARKARKWAVALWLQEESLAPRSVPEPYRTNPTGSDLLRRLRDRLQEADGARTERMYLGRRWWPELVEGVEDPVSLAACPVDGALDARLWEAWDGCLESDELERAASLARQRVDALQEVYGRRQAEVSSFTASWKQALDVAELAELCDRIRDQMDVSDPVEIYGREEEGAWRIDAAVRRLVVSGRPEDDLPEWSPALDVLPDWREKMAGGRYLSHLDDLAERTREAIAEGSYFSETTSVTHFWSKDYYRDELTAGEEVALFFLDGLRLDLAYELTERLRDTLASASGESDVEDQQSWSVSTSRWRATVPSETGPGMGALLPGSVTSFSVDLQDGSLEPLRSQKRLTTAYRERVLEEEGWSVTRDWDERWQAGRVAFLDSDIDKGGEAGIEEIEAHLSQRVEALAEKITGRLRQGGWSKAFVVTDHGFVLLPPETNMEELDPPEDAEAVSMRCVAPAGRDDGPGVRLEAGARALGYLDTSVRVLIQPRQRFRKRGVSDRRYFHGGLSLQESLLLFLEIEKS